MRPADPISSRRCNSAAFLCLAAIAGIFAFASSTLGQNVAAASLGGTVTDLRGSVIAGATVTVRNKANSKEFTSVTDEQGRYLFAYVPVGEYALRVEKAGFEPGPWDITATVGRVLTLDPHLDVKAVGYSVDVNTTAPVADKTRTPIAENVLPQAVEKLPLNGRNFLDLALLLPGVSKTNTGSVQRFAETSAVPGTGISIAGQRNLNNSFIVDGSSANDDSVELTGTFYSQEVIREFQVITSGAAAEYGRASSGFVNVVTWSGTNEFRGGAYGFFRNQRLDARNPLAARRDPLTQAQYGGTLGGPLKKDKTFFFSNFEQTRRHDSNIITISPVNVAAINAKLNAVGFQGQRIETGLVPSGYNTTNAFGRVDHRLNASNDLALTYNFYDIDALNARTVGGLNAVSRGTNLKNSDHTINTQWISSIRPAVINELRFEFRRSKLGAPAIDAVGPAVNISGVAIFGTATSSPTRRDIDLWQLSDSVSSVWNSHVFKAGGELIYNDLNIEFPGALQGVYTFNDLAAFQSGTYSQFQQAFGASSQKQTNPNAGLFAQDEWHVSRKLTFDLGLRYDLQFLPEPIKTDRNNLSPRFGFAFAPNEKTVIRGSIGDYYDRVPTRATSNALQRDGSKYIVAIFTPTTAGAPVFPNILFSEPSVLTIKPSITRIDPNIEDSSTTQANLQIERELPWNSAVSVGYLMVRGRHLILSRNVNVPTCGNAVLNQCRPDPNFGNISRYEGSGDSSYDGMVVSFRKDQGKHLTARVSYTLSKTIDNSGNFFFSTPQNNFDLRDEKALSDNDQRHRLTINGTWLAPKAVEVSWIYTYASGPPFNVLLGSDRNGDTNNNDRPLGVGRNTGKGFGYSSLDMRLSRKFRLGEHARVEFLVEGFNILNSSNLSIPNNTFGSGTAALPAFGRATAAFDPRQFQIGTKLSF